MGVETKLSDKERIEAAAQGKAPEWLRQVLTRIAARAGEIRPIEEDRTRLSDFIYRH